MKKVIGAMDKPHKIIALVVEGRVKKVNPLIDLHKGKTYTVMKISVEHLYKNRDGEIHKEETFFNIRTVGRLAERLTKYAKVGCKVRVVGRPIKAVYIDPETNMENSGTYIVAKRIEFNA